MTISLIIWVLHFITSKANSCIDGLLFWCYSITNVAMMIMMVMGWWDEMIQCTYYSTYWMYVKPWGPRTARTTHTLYILTAPPNVKQSSRRHAVCIQYLFISVCTCTCMGSFRCNYRNLFQLSHTTLFLVLWHRGVVLSLSSLSLVFVLHLRSLIFVYRLCPMSSLLRSHAFLTNTNDFSPCKLKVR